MSKFEYPRLSRPEIATILAETQVATISDQDLLRPNPEFVLDLYTRILIFLDFLHEEDHGQVEFAALEKLENPDLHVDSARIMKLYNRMKEAVASVECPKRFTLKDLIKPDADRFECFISALLNFVLHKETKMALLSPIVNEISLIEEQRKEWEDKIAELNAELENQNKLKERELPFVQEVEAKVKELHQTIASHNNQQASLRVTLRKSKEKIGEMNEKISSAEFKLVQAVQENANLRSKVVQSPEKLQKALEEKKLVRDEAKNTAKLAKQNYQNKTAVADVYSKVLKKMKKHSANLQAAQEQVNSAKVVDKDYKALKAKLSDEAVTERSLESILYKRQEKVDQLEESKRNLERDCEAKCEEASKELNQVKLDVETRKQNLEARQKSVEAVVSEVESINSRITLVKESAAVTQQELFSSGEAIIKELLESRNLISSLEKPYQDVPQDVIIS